MRLIDLSFDDPAQNLALDEALLDAAEEGHSGDSLRLWESPVRFVVLGTGQVFAEEVHEAACVRDGVPVLRRCSAGGCVLQGPGSLNYSLVFCLEDHPELRGISASYAHILDQLTRAFAARGVTVAHEGVCDLTHAGRKVSGNAQRRRRRAILHHGTLLHAPDYAAMARYLREPRDRPAYRGGLTHDAFVGCLPLGAGELRQVVARAFEADASPGAPTAWEVAHATAAAAAKYGDPAWTHRR
jgi:lipoate-protein ligase A